MYNNQSFYHGSHLKSGLAFVHFAFWENYISFSGWSRERCIDRVRTGLDKSYCEGGKTYQGWYRYGLMFKSLR